MQTTFSAHMTYRNLHSTVVIALALLLLSELLTPRPVQAAPPAQGPIVVDAIDNDPDNKLWACETSRVPFGDESIDAGRCFSFRYSIPRGGITSAAIHISISTLGAQQETDATAVAVGKPDAACAWGQGKMPGCVTLHGGFRGGEKSLNLNLFDIACDSTVQASAEAQALVRAQLQTGTLHFVLQDDTAVYRAQLVLNAGPATFQCGTSPRDSQEYVPKQPVISEFEKTVNTVLTGTSTPAPPDPGGAAAATLAGAAAVTLLAISNYLFSNPGFVQSIFKTPTSTPTTHSIDSKISPQPATKEAGALIQDQGITGPPEIELGRIGGAGGQTIPGQVAGSAGSATQSGLPELGELIDKGREQLVEAIPDVSDKAAGKIVDGIGEQEKERRVEEERKRLEAIVAEKKIACDQAGNALKQVIDTGGDFAGAQRVWQQCAEELQEARDALQHFIEAFPRKTSKRD